MSLLHPSLSILSKAVDAMLDPKEQADLKRHLESCASCRMKFQALGSVKARLQSLPALEENLNKLPEPPIPVFIPGALSKALLLKTLGLGIVVGVGITALITLAPTQPALKVISSSSDVISSEGLQGVHVPPDTTIRTPLSGNVDMEIPNKVLLRLRPGTTVTWQQVNRLQLTRPHIIVNVMRGEILARTVDGFWRSKLEIRTPSASAFVKGTAFGVKVDSSTDVTTLNVLAGNVFFSPHLGNVGVNVCAGRTSYIRSERLPSLPQKLSPHERRQMLEAYRIGKDPLAALVLGAGPERVEELLAPSLLFLSMKSHPQLQPFLRKALQELNDAILEEKMETQGNNLKVLEMALAQDITDETLVVPLRLFAGAAAARLGLPLRAAAHFRFVAEKFPRNPLASLGIAAMGVVAQNQWKDAVLAREYFKQVLARYPKSADAIYVREILKENPALGPSVPTGVAS